MYIDEQTKNSLKDQFKEISKKLIDISQDPELIGIPDWDTQSDEKAPLTRYPLQTSFDDEPTLSSKLNKAIDGYYQYEYERLNRYQRLLKAMRVPEISGALSIYADEATSEDLMWNIFNVYCDDEEVKTIVEEMIQRLGLDNGVIPWNQIRYMCGLGDEFAEVVISKRKREIHSINRIPPELLTRVEKNNVLSHFLVNTSLIENSDPRYKDIIGRTQLYSTFKAGREKIDPFRILHWRILSNTYAPYGEAIIDSTLPIIEELQLMEKGLVIARVVRAPERRVYTVNVGNAAGLKGINDAQLIVKQLKKKRVLNYFDQNKLDSQQDFFSGTEDLVIPRRNGEEPSTIDTLAQLNVAPPDDIEFVRDRIFPGLNVPRQYLYDDTFTNANVNLSNKSIRFARTVRRIQRFYLDPIYKMAYIELRLKGINKNRFESLLITMNNPSNLEELQKLELENQKWQLTSQIKSISTDPASPMYSDYDIFKNIFKKNENEILELMVNAKVQGKRLNPFEFIDEEERPKNWQILDQIDAIPSKEPPAPEGEGEGEFGGEIGEIPGEVGAALGEPETPPEVIPEPGASAPAPAPGTEAPPPEVEAPGPELTTAGEEIDGEELYTETLRKKALERKRKYLESKKKSMTSINEDLFLISQEQEKIQKRYTTINGKIKYYENKGELRGIKSQITLGEISDE